MDLLHEWIGKTIEQELGQAIQWRDDDANRSMTTGKVGDLVFDDDGSNLRVKSPKPRIVQLIKFVTFEEPLQATVSDGITRINVKFSAAASQRYSQKTRRSLTDGTPGGLIQLLDFKITATHLGPRPSRLTLFVEDFKSIGSNGSGHYGLATPHGIESRVVVKTQIEKLTIIRKAESPSGHASPNPSIRSQLSNGSSFDDPPSGTQAMFATQAPPLNAPAARISKPGNFGISMSTRPEKPLSKSAPVMGAPSISRPPITNGKQSLATSSETLLKLLNYTNKAPNPQPNSNNLTDLPATVSDKDEATTDADGRSTELHTPPSISSTNVSEQPLVEAAVTKKASSLSDSIVDSYSTQSIPAQPSNQDSTRKRISKRDVKISKDQEALLDSDSSWLPAQLGRREPVAHIPISILQSMNRDADLHNTLRDNSLKRKRGVNDPVKAADLPRPSTYCTTIDGIQESDSDVPISPGQWPPTPDHKQLPPDSSLGSANNSDHSETSGTVPFGGAKPTDTLSKTPLASTPVLSTPHSPISGLRSPRNLVAPSPIMVSNSAGEDHVFICRAIGCGKTYEDATALKYHIELRHNDKVLAQSLKCNIEDCHKSYPNWSALNYHLRHYHKDKKSGTHDNECNTSEHNSAQISTPRRSIQQAVGSQTSDINANNSEGQPSPEHGSGGLRKPSPSVRSRAVSSDSDLEVIVPKPLNVSRELFPSTASQPELPFTQVRRTPYMNVHGKGHDLQTSPSTLDAHDQPTRSLLNSTSHVTLSVPSTLNKMNRTSTYHHNLDADYRDAERSTLYRAIQVGPSEQPTGDQSQNVPHQHGIAEDNVDNTGFQSRNAGLEVPRNFHGMRNTTTETSRTITDGKRTQADASFLPPSVSHRRKRPKIPTKLDFTEELTHRRDPSEGARQIRQEFLASRRSSERSTPIQSPTMHLMGRVNGIFTSIEKPMADVEMTNADMSRSENVNIEETRSQHTESNLDLQVSGTNKNSAMNVETNLMKQTTQEPQQIDVDVKTSQPMMQDLSTNVIYNVEDAKAGAQEREPTAQVSGIGMAEALSSKHVNLTGDIPPLNGHARAHSPGSSIPQSFKDDRSDQEPIARDRSFIEQNKTSSIRALHHPTSLPTSSIPLQLVPAEARQISPSVKFEHNSPMSIPTSNDEIEPSPIASRVLSVGIHTPETGKNIRPMTSQPATAVEGVSSSVPSNIFNNFKTMYPSYPGDIHHFVTICRKISNLEKINQMEHQSLWDDFIIRHKVEYTQYLERCAEDIEDVLPFDEFYRTEIEEPLYNSRLVNRRNLQDILSLIPTAPQESDGEGHGKAKFSDGARVQLGESKSSAKPINSSEQAPVIDLTGEERRTRHAKLIETTLKGSPTSKKPASRRSLPWSDHISPPKIGVTQSYPSPKQHSRLKDFIDTPGGSRSNVYKPTPKSIDEKYDRPESYEASIRSAWGVRAHDILEPYCIDKIDQRQLHLLKDIAENVDLAEGRRLIEKQVVSRSKGILGGGALPMLTDVDLEAVREAVLRRKATPIGGQSRKPRAGDKSSAPRHERAQ
ncbi:hypothetical protein N7G274_009011 [Stereocaulon virgatum]|uniref:C2H2-type domain-containing protein n=1 Tax=Stereocaulon virgatum TaxID=373712 RepID=A0ABR3ZXH3_9LECA